MRIEWEHIVPAWTIGHNLQCWQRGGRSYCKQTSSAFNAMEADLFNITPVVGSLNALRSNYQYGMIEGEPREFGACNFEVDKKTKTVEPPDEAMGFVARTSLYMADKYDLRISPQQRKLFNAWNRMYPPSEWERERDARIAKIMGWHNPYVVESEIEEVDLTKGKYKSQLEENTPESIF